MMCTVLLNSYLILKENIVKKIAVLLIVSFSSSALAGVSSIREDGNKSVNGETIYKVTCDSGREYRIYRHNGSWHDAYSGNMGGDSRSLQEQAKKICN